MATIAKIPRIKTTKQLADAANPRNPRTITPEQLKMLADSLKRFGDLSGLVYNTQTGHLVGGHQRVKLLGESPVTITERYKAPTPTGTLAEGYVTYEGERFVYRAVNWDTATEEAAMIAANKHGGDWDFPALSQLLVELDGSDFDLSLTGFSAAELEKMVKVFQPGETEESVEPLTAEDMNLLPAHVRMVQLFLTVETLPAFMDKIRTLQSVYRCENITDTAVLCVEKCYHADHTESDQGEASGSTGLSNGDQNAGEDNPAGKGRTDRRRNR
jgi:hypothetical protein